MYDLIPFPGASSLRRLRREMDDLWGRFFEDAFSPLWKERDAFVPVVDVKETEDSFEVTVEVPGISKDDIEVTLEQDVLTIKGEKKEESEKKEGDYHLVERRYGSFSRSIRLPKQVDTKKKLQAVHKDGVLRITLPKAEKEISTPIEVKAA